MNININHYVIALIACILLIIGSCSRRSDAMTVLDLAESIVNDKPDSALRLINTLNPDDLSNDSERARYSLLNAIAIDKNWIDTTDYRIIEPAVGYYLRHGNPDEKLRTLYYSGRIYDNQNNQDSAMAHYLRAADLCNDITDTLVLANDYVAMATLYYQEYDIKKFIDSNLKAADLYVKIGRYDYATKGYTCAINGFVMINNPQRADSLRKIAFRLKDRHPHAKKYLFTSELSYIIRYGKPDEIRAFLDENRERKLSHDDSLSMIRAYARIGQFDRADTLLSSVVLKPFTFDTLRYEAVKVDFFEKQQDYQSAYEAYNRFSSIQGRYQMNLLSQDLLFADKRHKLEIENLTAMRNKNRTIRIAVYAIIGLLLLVGWLYYLIRLVKTRRRLAEKENDNFRLEHEILLKDKDLAILQRDEKIQEAEILESDKKRLEEERRLDRSTMSDMKTLIDALKTERDNIKRLYDERSATSDSFKKLMQRRVNMLNGLVASEITNNHRYAKEYHKWVKQAHKDKEEFLNEIRNEFEIFYPNFIKYLKLRGLNDEELNVICLHVLGLFGKEIGTYLDTKRHYIVSHQIREKLNIDEHETNLRLYVERLIERCEFGDSTLT